MKKVRQIIFWGHLLAGTSAGVVILIMSITGALLAFQPQIERFAAGEAHTVQIPSQTTPRLSAQTLFARLREGNPNARPTALTIQADRSAAASFALGRERMLYVNPYDGSILGEGAMSVRAFFRAVTDWHRWLGAQGENQPVARAVTGACNAAFLALALSGLYIWLPRKFSWRNIKPVLLFRRGIKGRARDFNWHNVAGFWCAAVLAVLAATGMVMSYQWANNLVYTLTGSPRPAQQGPPGGVASSGPREAPASAPTVPDNLDKLWARAEQTAVWESITLRLPQRAGMPTTFAISERGTWNPRASSQLTLDTLTAEVVKWEPYAQSSTGRKVRSWIRSVHTGEAGRLPGQLTAGVASLGGGLLVYTGLALVWRRFRTWLARKLKRTADVTALPGGLASRSGFD